MGGLAAVVAAGIIAIVFMQAFSTYYTTSTHSSNLLLQSLKDQAQQVENSIQESILLSNLTVVNSSSIVFLASNTGTASIPATAFGEMDVFLASATNGSVTTFQQIRYQQLNSTSDTWRVFQVTTSTGKPEVLNPVSLPDATSGQWDPSEVLHVAVTLNSLEGITNSSSVAVRMCTPAGQCTSVSN